MSGLLQVVQDEIPRAAWIGNGHKDEVIATRTFLQTMQRIPYSGTQFYLKPFCFEVLDELLGMAGDFVDKQEVRDTAVLWHLRGLQAWGRVMGLLGRSFALESFCSSRS
jgi:hypothetical protein